MDQLGHQGNMLLVDRANKRAITITFWDTEENLRGTTEQANELRQRIADSVGLTIESVEGYEVASQQMPKSF